MMTIVIDNRKDDTMQDEFASKVFSSIFFYAFDETHRSITVANDDSRELQLLGVDYITVNFEDGYSFFTDMKVQMNYMNMTRDTYSLEISNMVRLRDGSLQEVPGWFLKREDCLTDRYLFVWPHKVDTFLDKYVRSASQVYECEFVLVEKAEILRYLKNYHRINYMALLNGARELRKTDSDGSIVRREIGKAYKGFQPALSKSTKFVECPINLILPKDVLASLPGAVHYYYKRV